MYRRRSNESTSKKASRLERMITELDGDVHEALQTQNTLYTSDDLRSVGFSPIHNGDDVQLWSYGKTNVWFTTSDEYLLYSNMNR